MMLHQFCYKQFAVRGRTNEWKEESGDRRRGSGQGASSKGAKTRIRKYRPTGNIAKIESGRNSGCEAPTHSDFDEHSFGTFENEKNYDEQSQSSLKS